MNYTAILLLAGSSSRFKGDKCFYQILNKPLYKYSLHVFEQDPNCNQIILVTSIIHLDEVKENENQKIKVIEGGSTRFQSVKNALPFVQNDYFLIHDAARPNLKASDIDLLLSNMSDCDACYLANQSVNTLRTTTQTLDRSQIYQVLTPQAFHKSLIDELLKAEGDYPDEIALFEKTHQVKPVLTKTSNPKLTYQEDLPLIEYLLTENKQYRIGHSYDFHPFIKGDHLTLGMVEIPFNKTVSAVSDGDCLLHVIVEAIYGALASGDLGEHYPPSNPKYQGISSSKFLFDAKSELKKAGYSISNIDVSIYLETPKLVAYKPQMKEKIADVLAISSSLISIKATTMEKCGLVGKSEGIACEAIVLIKKH